MAALEIKKSPPTPLSERGEMREGAFPKRGEMRGVPFAERVEISGEPFVEMGEISRVNLWLIDEILASYGGNFAVVIMINYVTTIHTSGLTTVT